MISEQAFSSKLDVWTDAFIIYFYFHSFAAIMFGLTIVAGLVLFCFYRHIIRVAWLKVGFLVCLFMVYCEFYGTFLLAIKTTILLIIGRGRSISDHLHWALNHNLNWYLIFDIWLLPNNWLMTGTNQLYFFHFIFYFCKTIFLFFSNS